MADTEGFELLMHRHVPAQSVAYCTRLWEQYPFHFKVTNTRKTKAGDFRFRQSSGYTITVNHDLNPYAFLLTYIHEVAHLIVWDQKGRKVKPHGQEWKATFKNLILPLLNPQVFPNELLPLLARYFKNPKASTYSDKPLYLGLRKYDANPTDQPMLQDLSINSTFKFNNRVFVLEAFRRTKVLCKDTANNKQYLIAKIANVELIPI